MSKPGESTTSRVHDRPPARPGLDSLLAAAKVQFEAMSEEEIQAMLDVQRESWVRGEMQLDRKPDDLPPQTMADILRDQLNVRRIKPAPHKKEGGTP